MQHEQVRCDKNNGVQQPARITRGIHNNNYDLAVAVKRSQMGYIMKRPYEFYRVLVFVGGGALLIYLGGTLLTAIGAGLMILSVIFHITSIAQWTKEDIIKSLSPEKAAVEKAEEFAKWVLKRAQEEKARERK
jgi:hypothetical protein